MQPSICGRDRGDVVKKPDTVSGLVPNCGDLVSPAPTNTMHSNCCNHAWIHLYLIHHFTRPPL
eukprot:scaffold15914_cov80-Cylindrotheca_fusiformis.AAC.4